MVKNAISPAIFLLLLRNTLTVPFTICTEQPSRNQRVAAAVGEGSSAVAFVHQVLHE